MNAANFGNTTSTPEQIKEFNKNIPMEKQTVKFDSPKMQQDNTRVAKPVIKPK